MEVLVCLDAVAAVAPGDPPVLGPYDAGALEVALQLRDRLGVAVHAVAVGDTGAIAALRRGLGHGLASATRIVADPSIVDGVGVATLIGAWLTQAGWSPLLLCGFKGASWASGTVGPVLADRLGVRLVTRVRWIERAEVGSLGLVHECGGVLQRVTVSPPAVVTTTDDQSTALRQVTGRGVLRAEAAPIHHIGIEELGLAATPLPLMREVRAEPVPEGTGATRFVDGGSLDETAAEFARTLVRLVDGRP